MRRPRGIGRGKSWLIVALAGIAAVTILSSRLRTELSRSADSSRLVSASDAATARLPPLDEASGKATLQFLFDRVKTDPEDFVAQNMLASHLLRQVRETGDADLLLRATRAAQSSLASVPAERNAGGLSALARAEMAGHDFTKAREHALKLTEIDPGTLGSYAVLADILLELGDYANADAAIQNMRKLGSDTAETEIRLGRLLFLQGDTAGAQRHLFRALAFVQHLSSPPRETLAWCQWQAGETEFSTGDYGAAERHYRDALRSFPGYVQALASLGRLRAANGDLPDAIAQYEQAVRKFPDPTFVAALGDLYHRDGREEDANRKYELVELIGRLSTLNGARYNRQIALFYADHDRKVDQAYENAVREYADRKDIYGADTLAWTSLKAGKLAEARQAIQAALRLSTQDSRLFYHAGMIARASGDMASARTYLRRALARNPGFDPLQASVAKKSA